MREVARRKTTILRLNNKKIGIRRSPRLIVNQATLVSSLINLMTTQKSIVAILRVKSSDAESTIPIGFKLEKDSIPPNLVPLSMHPENVVEIQIDNFPAIPAMIVAIGDDSQELLQAYKFFYESCRNYRIPRLSSRINYWIPLNYIVVSRTPCNKLRSITQATFEAFFKRIGVLKNKVSSMKKDLNSRVQDVVDLDSEDHPLSGILSASEIKKEPEDSCSTIMRSPHNICSSAVNLNPNVFDFVKLNSQLGEIRNEIDTLKLSLTAIQDDNEYRLYFQHISKIFDCLMNSFTYIRDYFLTRSTEESAAYEQSVNKSVSKSINNQTTFHIGIDKTVESGSRILIEGILPVSASKYRKAVNSLAAKIEERDPAVIMTAFVKFCFPSHWIADITLRGYGGKRSLISQWNHQDPLSNPVKGNYVNGLGEQRLRALMDHALRKCGQSSYGIATEKLLIAAISKSIHYNKTKIKKDGSPRKGSSSKNDIILSSESEDESFGQRSKLSRKRPIIEDDDEDECYDWDNLQRAYDSRIPPNPLDFLSTVRDESQKDKESLNPSTPKDSEKSGLNLENEIEKGFSDHEYRDLSDLSQVVPISLTNLRDVASTPMQDASNEDSEKEDQEITNQDSGIDLRDKGNKRLFNDSGALESASAIKKQKSESDPLDVLPESAEDSSNLSAFSSKTENRTEDSAFDQKEQESKQEESNQEDSNQEESNQEEAKKESGTSSISSDPANVRRDITDDQLLSLLASRQKDPRFAEILASLEKRI